MEAWQPYFEWLWVVMVSMGKEHDIDYNVCAMTSDIRRHRCMGNIFPIPHELVQFPLHIVALPFAIDIWHFVFRSLAYLHISIYRYSRKASRQDRQIFCDRGVTHRGPTFTILEYQFSIHRFQYQAQQLSTTHCGWENLSSARPQNVKRSTQIDNNRRWRKYRHHKYIGRKEQARKNARQTHSPNATNTRRIWRERKIHTHIYRPNGYKNCNLWSQGAINS